MKKIILLISVVILLVNFTSAQELTKEEKKRLKEEVKSYMNDLAGYKAKMQDIRTTLDSNDAEIRRQKDDIAVASTQIAELDNKVIDLLSQLEKCHAEKNMLMDGSVPGDPTVYDENGRPLPRIVSGSDASTATATGNSSNANVTSGKRRASSMNNAAKQGTVYKVQFGLYKEFNITKYFEEPRFIGYEEENGMNRYVISDFSEEGVAMNFVQDVRRMGIKDAFVAKYIDGQRVYEWSKNPKYKGKPVPTSLEEALEMDKKGKKGKKNN